MREDQLKKFLQENRSSIDDEVPGMHIWSNIEKKLPGNQARSITLWKWTAAAAVALLLIASGVIIGLSNNMAGNQDQMAMREYAETERYYVSQVNEKLMAVERQLHDPILKEDLRQLDEIYDELKLELVQTENPNKSEIINAMIMNYQTKVAILEKVLERLEEAKSTTQNESNYEI
jgi:hypothetical protein